MTTLQIGDKQTTAKRNPLIVVTLGVGLLLMLLLAYLFLKSSTLDPVAWEPPVDQGYVGEHQANNDLVLSHRLQLTHNDADGSSTGIRKEMSAGIGPESVALSAEGWLVTGTKNGDIWRKTPDQSELHRWVATGGRPLGLQFGPNHHLYVADAYKGLLKITPRGEVELLTNQVDGTPILYADDLDVDSAGVVYFTDASTKFGALEINDTLAASVLALVEHGGHGRLLKYDPTTKQTEILMQGLQFANGVALSSDERFLIVAETGSYRLIKFWLRGAKAGTHDVLIDNLPGFPDNVTRSPSGYFWVSFPTPRSALMDRLAPYPTLRKMVMNLPAMFHPKPVHYTHIMAIDEVGQVVGNLQSQQGVVPVNSSVLESACCLYLGSLETDFIGVVAL